MIIETNFRAVQIILKLWKWLLFYLLLCIAVSLTHWYFRIDIDISNTEISMIGIALSILMGFRVSSAYDRWWEARKIWGSLVNNSRSLARQLITFSHHSSLSPEALEAMIHRHIAFVYAMGCRLREKPCDEEIKPFLYPEEYEQVIGKSHMPNLLMLHNMYAIKELLNQNVITDLEFQRVDETMALITDNLGGSERIKNTPFPVPYSYFTWLLVHIFAIFIPFGMVDSFGYLTIPMGIGVIFIFLVIEQIAIEIQDPFSNRENDIPVSAISQMIEIDLKEMLGDTDLPSKEEPKEGILM